MISKVELYANEKGFEVKQLSPIIEGDVIDIPSFFGKAILAVNLPNGVTDQQIFEFPFPKDIKNIEEAFEKFEITIEQQIKKQQEEYRKMMDDKKKELVLPGQGGPMTIPFPMKKNK